MSSNAVLGTLGCQKQMLVAEVGSKDGNIL
jgi:hypothetical protein